MRAVIKPMTLGLLAKPYGYKGQMHLAVSALAFFRLGESPALIPEHQAWPVITPALPAQQMLDEIMPKACADVLLAGTAHAPEGKAVKEMMVSLRCGEVDKSLRITGDRQWRYGLVPLQQVDAPLPFTAMPLDATRAWGGKDYPANPLGCGYTDSRWPAFFKRNQGVLPNISLAGEIRRPGRRRHAPAGLGPWPINHPARRRLAGSYNKRWLKEDFPGLARNIDWRFFNMAPPDQRLKRFFKGDEPYCLTGLHPLQTELTGKLPGIKARAFIRTERAPFAEVPLEADTLWFFPDQNLGVLIFHGHHPIEDSEAQDVQAVMLAYERLGEARRLTHYQEVLQLRLDPATRHLHVFNDAQLTMPLTPQPAAIKPAVDVRRQALQARLDEMEADFWAAADMEKPADYTPPVLPEPLLPDPQLPDGSLDFTALMAAADAQLTRAKADAEAEQAAMQAQCDAELAKLEQPMAETEALVTAEEALARANPQQQLDAELARLPLQDLSTEQQDELVQAIAQGIAQGRALRRLAQEPISKPITADAAIALAQLVDSQVQQHLPLAGFNLAGVTLVGQSFVGMNLAEVNFERGNFSHCDFSNADLRGVSFVGATLSHCRFQGTQMKDGNCSGASITACEFSAAQLQHSQWSKTQLHGCHFSHADLSGASFRHAHFVANQFPFATLDQTIWADVTTRDNQWDNSSAQQFAWLGCELSGCTFNGIRWQQGAFLNCVTEGLVLADAQLEKILITGEADKSLWSATDWRGAKLVQCGFRQTHFKGADFTRANFSNCDFGNTRLQQLIARHALFHQCILMGAAAPDADLRGADLCNSLAMKMNLSGADLRDTQLWRAHLWQAQLANARTDNAWPSKQLEVAA